MQGEGAPADAGEGRLRRWVLTRSALWRRLPWSLSEIRRLGDWGHASNHLGSAWEHYACRRLLDDGEPWFLPAGGHYRPAGVVPLGLDDDFGPRLNTAGRRAADAFVVGRVRETIVIQPVDFKFSLDHAEAGQIGIDVSVSAGSVLEPEIAERLGSALEIHRLDDWPEHVVIGALVAPPSDSNRRTRVPGRPVVRWLRTGIDDFFSTLPAAEAATWLARLDGVWPIRDDFDLAEAYYRLGAAVAGAVGRIAKPLFAENAELRPASLAEIESWRKKVGADSAASLIEALRPEMTERRARESRLGQVLRRPAGREQLNAATGQAPETGLDTWSPAARRALAQAMADDRAATLARGAALVAAGKTEDEALATLQSEFRRRSDRFLKRLHELAA